jgi:hypothetical protein
LFKIFFFSPQSQQFTPQSQQFTPQGQRFTPQSQQFTLQTHRGVRERIQQAGSVPLTPPRRTTGPVAKAHFQLSALLNLFMA